MKPNNLGPLTTLTIKSDNAKVIIAPDLGGSLLSYSCAINGIKRNILRPNNWPKSVIESSYFPLVPFSNRIREGTFSWNDKKISLPLNFLPEKHAIHGHGWKLRWQTLLSSEKKVILHYHHISKEWPFSYTVRQKIELKDSELIITLTLVNSGRSTMPSGLGFHPYFTKTKNTSVFINAKTMWAVDNESMPTKIMKTPQSFYSERGFNLDGRHLDNTLIDCKDEAIIFWPEWKTKAIISSSKNCKHSVIYSPKDENFFCIEPVTHCTDEHNNLSNSSIKNNLVKLDAGEKMIAWMRIAPSKI